MTEPSPGRMRMPVQADEGLDAAAHGARTARTTSQLTRMEFMTLPLFRTWGADRTYPRPGSVRNSRRPSTVKDRTRSRPMARPPNADGAGVLRGHDPCRSEPEFGDRAASRLPV